MMQFNNEQYYFPKYSKWIFVVLFIIMSIVYNYHNILFKSPQSIHLWRQCDCLSITMNYYQDNNPFLEPSVHYLGHDGTGKTVSDFPLIYYSVAQLWKIFGHQEFIYRLVVLIFFFFGLFALFRLFENKLNDSILALTISLLLFSSPTIVYYANNFLMDIPAFSLALIGLYFFYRFSQTSKNRFLYYSFLAYTLAGLLKISSLLSFAAILGLFILELFNLKLKPDKKIFQNPLKQSFLFLGVIVIQFVWYLYARNYNSNYNYGIFLIGILPIWDIDINTIKYTFIAINEKIKLTYFRRETQIILVFMFFFILTFYKRIGRKTLLLTCFLVLGFLLFITLFFQPLRFHDYYTINLFIVIPMVILSFMLLMKSKYNRIYKSLLFRIILIAFLVHNVDFARRRIEKRYRPTGWQNEYYTQNLQPFKEISPYLRSIGIEKDDKVICISDNSINISLYLMNQKGWTNYGISLDSNKFDSRINLGAKYLFIHDDKVYKEPFIQRYIKNKIGKFKNIDIYAL